LDVAPADVHVRLSGVTRVYPGKAGGVQALGPVDLELIRGEFFAVVGPSGCGKSTLLEMIAGLAQPTEGSVEFEGRPIGAGVPDGVGVVFQENACFPWLTVADNLTFGLRRLALPKGEVERRLAHALELMGLEEFAKAHPAQLSGGMRQRVCIARTLVTEPRLILLDEPFGALDQQTRLLMGDELLRLWRATGATVLLITHALDEAAMLADRVAVMSSRPGRILEVIETGWGPDRDSRIVSDPAFGAVTARLWSLLRTASMLPMGQGRAAARCPNPLPSRFLPARSAGRWRRLTATEGS
jgi:NitT/TauT family transport system ATP-binding protein